ncbi:MAG: class I SAM-dependent methyltransferase [Gammaproteobacteria bacterium]|nr:class I SAM-dependent methyltransferase [Gammaproteobacteria bacterium]MDH3534591.1 class I SAM-dependent methyltransferase [Gammaproteobacteria bacterium]
MSEQDRIKWNQRYAEDSYRKGNPVTLLQDWLPKITTGKALDVACGAGRNAILLAQNGFRVDAIDISAEGLSKARQSARQLGLDVTWIEHDLDLPFRFDRDYDLIVVMWYVDLDLVTRLCDCLAPGGYLVCEEHLVTDEEVIGPTSRNYRVEPGQLRAAASGVDILLYEEAVATSAGGEPVASARLVARRPRSHHSIS